MVMKKVFFSMVLAFMALMNVDAQEVQIATLQNADGTQLFYGINAFKEAMAAANHGDVIILSEGKFNSANITKAVSIYGAGYEVDADATAELKKHPTIINNGDISITLDLINEQPVEGLYVEGVFFDNTIWVKNKLVAATFAKCRFGNFHFWRDSSNMQESEDCYFSQCRFSGWFEPGNSQRMTINNCIINLLGRNLDQSTCSINHSVIYHIVVLWRGVLKDCIVGIVCDAAAYLNHTVGSGNVSISLYTTCVAYNTIFNNKNALDWITVKVDNWLLGETDWTKKLFGETQSSYNDNFMYVLTDEAKKTYIGTDGKEVGIYGGTAPFSPILTIPRVVKKDIAAETVDGKLKVNIKVEAGDNSL